MELATFKLGKKEYILLTREEYSRLTEAEQDRRDADKAAKAIAKFRQGKSRAIPIQTLKRQLGL